MMNQHEREMPEAKQIDWGNFKYWRVWDPIPFWILDKEKIEQIMVVQFESRINQMQNEMEQMKKVVEIIRQR